MSEFQRRLGFMTLVVLLAAAAASGGVLLWNTLNPPRLDTAPMPPPRTAPMQPAPALKVGDMRPQLQLRDLHGALRSLAEWDGKLLIVNFWATWCPPCLEEVPTFIKAQDVYRDRGVVFLGIALDSPDNVRDFVAAHGVNYEILHGEKDAIEASRAFGNAYGALPFTALVGRDGHIRHLHQGILEQSTLQSLINENL